MGAWDSKVSDIYNSLNDWLNVRGGDVSDLALSLINRARQSLWQEYAWDYLVKKQTLTLVDNTASLPDDFGRIIHVYYSTTNDGVPDWYFSRNDKRLDRGYEIESTFSIETGTTFQIKFFQTPSHTPILKYVVDLPDCTAQEHYMFFPSQLVYRKAQLEHIQDKPVSANEIQVIQDSFDTELRNFVQAHQYTDNAMEIVQQDSYFNMIDNESYPLNGNIGPTFSDRSNSYDHG